MEKKSIDEYIITEFPIKNDIIPENLYYNKLDHFSYLTIIDNLSLSPNNPHSKVTITLNETHSKIGRIRKELLDKYVHFIESDNVYCIGYNINTIPNLFQETQYFMPVFSIPLAKIRMNLHLEFKYKYQSIIKKFKYNCMCKCLILFSIPCHIIKLISSFNNLNNITSFKK